MKIMYNIMYFHYLWPFKVNLYNNGLYNVVYKLQIVILLANEQFYFTPTPLTHLKQNNVIVVLPRSAKRQTGREEAVDVLKSLL